MERYQDLLHDLREPTVSLRHAIPETWATFVAFQRAPAGAERRVSPAW